MFGQILNWRRNLYLGLLIVLLISSFSPLTKHLCAAWQAEMRRFPGITVLTVKKTEIMPAWRRPIYLILQRLQSVINGDLFIWGLCQLLAIPAKVSLQLLSMIISLTILNKNAPVRYEWSWSASLSEVSNIEAHLIISVLPYSTENVTSVSLKDLTDKVCLITDGIAAENLENCPLSEPWQNISADTDADALLPISEVQAENAAWQPDTLTGDTAALADSPISISYGYPETKNFNDDSIVAAMKKFYNTLSEKDRRRYAAIEAMKKGHGGAVRMANLLGCDRKTVARGIRELKAMPHNAGYVKRIRKSGGGRKPYHVVYKDIDEKFTDVLKHHTAGDPMKCDVLWTNLSLRKISEKLASEHEICVSTTVIRQLLRNNDFRRRKAIKKATMKAVRYRNVQFENIAVIKSLYKFSDNPIISMDTKKKEDLGNFYRDGKLYTKKELITYDHDFKSFAEGVVIPHGIFDYLQNKGFINIGVSRDTGEFACDSLRIWWHNYGQYDYSGATSILILCDGGGSNSSRHYIFKEDLQKLVDEIGIEIRIAHYPPYTSKYNPIEHRMFPHVTRACQGVIFRNIEIVKELMEKTETAKGLKVTVNVINKIYETGRKVAKDFKETMKIQFDEYLPQWNYRVIPNG